MSARATHVFPCCRGYLNIISPVRFWEHRCEKSKAKNLTILYSQSLGPWALKPLTEDTVEIMTGSCIIFHLFEVLEGHRVKEVIVSHVFVSHCLIRKDL